MRLSAAKIPTVLLVGNHDVSPASGRAHTLHEFATLSVPHIHIADRIELADTGSTWPTGTNFDRTLGVPQSTDDPLRNGRQIAERLV